MSRYKTFLTYSQTHLHLFPIIASAAWSLTLTTLLIRWLSLGRPQLPGQVNPLIPFISDIAAQAFKPIFIIGCMITSVCFIATVWCVHYVRYAEAFYGLVEDTTWRKGLSAVAMLTGLFAGGCLFLLSIFDTVEEHEKHKYLLLGTFGGLAASSLMTQVVWWDEMTATGRFPGLRKWCIVNNILVICITGVGIAFLACLYIDYYKSAGVLEWTVTYLGALWLASFSGYIRFREDTSKAQILAESETQPLLAAHDLA